MNPAGAFMIIWGGGEAVAFGLFKFVNRLMFGRWEFSFDASVIKGLAERLFLFLSLVYGFPHARSPLRR